MANDNEKNSIAPEEYKRVTEGMYKQNLELVRLYKQVDDLNHELGTANESLKSLIQRRESLIHLINHRVKGAFTHSKYIFAEMLEGTFGELNEEMRKRALQGLVANNFGIKTIDLFLNAANMEKGTIKFNMVPLDFKELVLKVIEEKSVAANAKGNLKLEKDIKEGGVGAYQVLGDELWLKEAINNLVDNAIKYSKEGTINVSLESTGDKIKLYVKDTGIGITDEDKKNLFTEGGRGKDSTKMNVDSTGYGLFSVKLIVESHKGKVWAESEGPGKGSTFYVELDVLKKDETASQSV